jgi:hypothetical protein
MANAHDTPPAQPTDRDQLRRYFDSVFQDIDAFLAEKDEDRREELRAQLEPLCFMKLVEHKIQIAWGGPEYGFKLYYDPEGKEWVSGLFYWADWFKYEEEPLSPAEMDRVLEVYAMDCMVE